MKYNICGYSQTALLNYNLDGNDAILLRTIIDIYSSLTEKSDCIIFENHKFVWLTYGYISEQLQILGSLRTIKRKIDNFVEKKLLKRIVLNSRNNRAGKYMYFTLGENYTNFLKCDFSEKTNQVTTCQEDNDKLSLDPMTNCHIKDSSITDSSVKNNNTHTESAVPVIADIMKKYDELDLPKYTFRPKDRIIMECIRTLGAVNFFKALEIMSRSSFVKNTFSVNMIFKINNLKNALNGTFNDRKKPENSKNGERLNVADNKTYKPNENNEELFKLLGMR